MGERDHWVTCKQGHRLATSDSDCPYCRIEQLEDALREAGGELEAGNDRGAKWIIQDALTALAREDDWDDWVENRMDELTEAYRKAREEEK